MIQRDGANASLWQSTVPPYETSNQPEKNIVYDVIVIGGGITGITTALLLQEAGKKCLVLEAANLCFGTTGGTTAHINTLLDTPYTTISKNFGKEDARLVASVATEAVDLIRQHVNVYNIDCGFTGAHAYLFAQDEKQEKELESIFDATRDAGLKIEYTDKIPMPLFFSKAVNVAGQAKFHPVKYVHALAKAFENMGGVIMQQCRVTGVENNETVSVESEKGTFKSKDVIYATHIPMGVNLLHLRCVPYRSYAMAVLLDGENYPTDLAYDMYDPYHYYRTQEVDGTNYLIVGGKDHKTAHEPNTDKCFLELEAHIREHFDVREISYKWSSQYFESADGLPYIGHLPGQPENVYVATGFGGNGMTYGTVAAITLKRMLLNQDTKYVELFDPNRIKPIAGFANFIKHNADVVKQFVGKFFSGEELNEIADLAPGEGKIVKYNDEKIGLYKDEEGTLHAVNPVCTHLKCEVKWNGTEKSWDCPCHGARYSYDGQVITGPADKGLETISIQSLAEH